MKRIGTVVLCLIVGAAFGLVAGLSMRPSKDSSAHSGTEQARDWTCSMHPQIHQPGPGRCPLCGMDLVPVVVSAPGKGSERLLVMSDTAMRLAEVRTEVVERRVVPVELRMTGKIAYDETRWRTLAMLTDALVDRSLVGYAGVKVRSGEHLAELYSPEVFSAVREMTAAGNERELADAAKRKLSLLGVSDREIERLRTAGRKDRAFVLDSPMDGTVTKWNVKQGQWLMKGENIGEIVDLSSVWAVLDAYERDVSWIRYGQKVEIEADALPGRKFSGVVGFVSQELRESTRTVMVRANVPNRDGGLKAGMFVHARISAHVADGGNVSVGELAGKWICPMHPESVSDAEGKCGICGMALVKAESLGYAASTETGEAAGALVIPATAPLITGRRAVVYVAVPGKRGEFEGREIVLGPRAGDYYLVKEGLSAGEQVVANGAFKIDSSLQIQAKKSMMQDATASALSLEAVIEASARCGDALASDDLKAAKEQALRAIDAVASVNVSGLDGIGAGEWKRTGGAISDAARSISGAADIAGARSAYESLSRAVLTGIRRFDPSPRMRIRVVHCPMAFENKGADWIQTGTDVRNPYFGASMLTCGEVRETLGGVDGGKKVDNERN